MALEIKNRPFVSIQELNKVLSEYNSHIDGNGTVDIRFTNPVDRINIVFIAGLFLLYQEEKVGRFKLGGPSFGPKNRETKLYLHHINSLYRPSSNWLSIPAIKDLHTHLQFFSSSFTPVVYVSKETNVLFFNPIENPKNYTERIVKEFTDTYISNLWSRSEAKSYEKGYFGSESGISFSQRLSKQSPLFILVFCVLYYKDEEKKTAKNEFLQSDETLPDFTLFKNRLTELWHIAEDFVVGILELAKNIVDHSSQGKGVITFRAYDSEVNGKDFESFVFDYGEEGIIQKLQSDTNKLLKGISPSASDPAEQLLREDLALLSSNYHLENFLTPNTTNILRQQIARRFVHIGLLTFNELITENDGAFIASSGSGPNRDYYPSSFNKENSDDICICYGTAFRTVLPMNSPRPRIIPPDYDGPDGLPISKKLTEVINYHVESGDFRCKKKDENCIYTIRLKNAGVENNISREQEQILVDYILDLEREFHDSVSIAIDFDGVKPTSSNLLRILASVSTKTDKRLIVYNIECSLFYNMVLENQRFLKHLWKNPSFAETPYWIDGKAILFYTYYPVPDEDNPNKILGRYHFADILYGKDQNDFLLVNRKISYSFQNIITISGTHSPDKPSRLRDEASRYFAGEALLPFDILLSSDGRSENRLFLENLRLLLLKEFNPVLPVDEQQKNTAMTAWENYYRKRGGYSIKNTHFKVGTKYHSNQFVYGKGVFQNSYHTTRLALLLVRGIMDTEPKKTDHITLVGYEMYSELLLGLVEDLMQEMEYRQTDHFLVRDDKEGISRIQDPSKDIDKFFIVVPIVSTGSTSLRILRWMKNGLIEEKHNPNGFFHLISVIDPKKKDGLSVFPDVIPVTFIEIHVTWNDPGTCTSCFGESNIPSEGDNRAPLIEADKTSISPAMVYSFPRVKHPHPLSQFKDDVQAKAVCEDGYYGVVFNEQRFKESLLYKCDRRNEEYNVFSHDELLFIQNNRQDIIDWLVSLRGSLQLGLTDKVVIMAPSRDSNIAFINLVNTYLFGYSATILYLQDKEYIENFKLTAKPYLDDKRTRYKVVFVDDSIITGRSFNSIFNLVDVIYKTNDALNADVTQNGEQEEKAVPFQFYSAVVLINKATVDITQRISKLTGSLHCFMSVNLPGFMRISEQSPFDLEIKRYEELRECCLFERSKLHYAKKAEELDRFEKPNDVRPYLDKKEKRHLKMLGATHRLMDYFEEHTKEDYSFEDVVRVAGYDSDQDRYSVFKTLCQPPFILHSDILQAVFKWHDKSLFKLMGCANRKEQVENVKFMLRRAVFIKNYLVISRQFFVFLADVFGSEGASLEERYSSLQYFALRQYAELIRNNGWCAGQIREQLSPVVFMTPRGEQFKRMLMDSIGIVLYDFNDMLDNTPIYSAWKSIGFNKTEEDIKSFFDEKAGADIVKTNKFQIVNKAIPELFMDDKAGRQGVPNDIFWRYLYISACLRHDSHMGESISQKKLKEKTRIVLEGIRNLFGNNESVGAFFVVKNRRNDKTVVYDRDTEECHILSEAFLTDKKAGSFMQKFLDPIRPQGPVNIYSDDVDLDTIIELRQMLADGSGERWREAGSINTAMEFILPTFKGYKWMYILRLESLGRKRNWDKRMRVFNGIAPMGILCVYGKDEEDIKDSLGRKLLLLLRRDLSEFVRDHHRNDEFVELIVAERTGRFAYLAGHGRVVMQSLTEYENNAEELTDEQKDENKRIRDSFKSVVRTMERLQYLFATKDIDRLSADKDNRKVIHENFSFTELDATSLMAIAKDINLMAKAIYKSNIVEISERVKYDKCRISASDTLEFSKDIIMMIVFELIWNAKKNRFHLVKECCNYLQVPKDFMNSLDIELSIHKTRVNEVVRPVLKIIVSGTGPKVEPKVADRINNDMMTKPDEMNSGLEMIQNVLKVLDGDNKLRILPGEPRNSIYTNTVTVEIYG